MVAVAAAAAGAAEAVVVAEVAPVAQDVAAVAVCPGVVAASADQNQLPIALPNTGYHGRARQDRPGRSMS